jgi:hypothetical protein
MKKATSLYQSLLEFFDSGWFMSRNDAEQFVRVLCNGKKGENWEGYAQADGNQIFIFYSVWPSKIEIAKRSAMVELLTHINYGIKLGNFEMDLNDGEIRYKTSLFSEDKNWKPEVIRSVVFPNLNMMAYYWESIQALIEGQSLEKALALIDNEL